PPTGGNVLPDRFTFARPRLGGPAGLSVPDHPLSGRGAPEILEHRRVALERGSYVALADPGALRDPRETRPGFVEQEGLDLFDIAAFLGLVVEAEFERVRVEGRLGAGEAGDVVAARLHPQ